MKETKNGFIVLENGDKRKLYCDCNSDFSVVDAKLRVSVDYAYPFGNVDCDTCNYHKWYYINTKKGSNIQSKIKRMKESSNGS